MMKYVKICEIKYSLFYRNSLETNLSSHSENMYYLHLNML